MNDDILLIEYHQARDAAPQLLLLCIMNDPSSCADLELNASDEKYLCLYKLSCVNNRQVSVCS